VSRTPPSTRIAVIGGAGAMGQITVRDLCETAPADAEVIVSDLDSRRANALVRRLRTLYPTRRVRAVPVDIALPAAAANSLRGVFGIINCCHHDLNLRAMQLALAIGSHYVDLGGLFHVTRRQLKLHAQFKSRGLLALLGMGAAPGIVNVLARAAADGMERVHEIHIAVAGIDRAIPSGNRVLATSYSLQTVLDEASLPAPTFTQGRFGSVPAMSDPETIDFLDPVGPQRASRTIHSEVATLPLSFRKKGIRDVSFRIAFPPDLDRQLRLISALGLLSREKVAVGRVRVAPRDVLMALLEQLPKPSAAAVPDEYEMLRVAVHGEQQGRQAEDVMTCHAPGVPAWGVGVDADTGCPPSIAMQLLLRGEIDARGVLPPEVAVPVAPFLAELDRRGMRVERAGEKRTS
jgi:saccharopine dehydrogenase-like NADP-dependent oxidoreductase